MDKRCDLGHALRSVRSGMTVAVGGFGGAGFPARLVEALAEQPVRDLVLVSNNAARFEALVDSGAVARIICSFPFGGASPRFRTALDRNGVSLVLLPQGTLAERLRAAGAGLGGVLTSVGIGTEFAEGRRIVTVNGKDYLLEPPLPADVALVHAWRGDRFGNLCMRGTARNFNLVMAMAAARTVAEVEQVVEPGAIPADRCDVASLFVDVIAAPAGAAEARA